MRRSTVFLANSRWLHRLLLWPAMLALCAFVLSGFLHIILTWTGPQAARSTPPQAQFPASDWAALPRALKQNNITHALVVKLLPSQGRNLLQVTQDEQQPRRYFDLSSGAELPGYDAQQAVWLAQYYLQDATAQPIKTEFITQFDDTYPWVNRLLPVYRLHFAGDNALILTIHTETGALADISNTWKRSIQNVFRYVHTASWLDHAPALRMLLMLALLGALIGTLLIGLCLLYGMRARPQTPSTHRRHRRLAHVLWLPLLGFPASGLYHLLYSEYGQPENNLRISQPFSIPADELATVSTAALPTQALQSVSVLSLADGRLLYRGSIGAAHAGGHHDAHAQRQARFDGIAKEQAAVYLDARTATTTDLQDEQLARLLAQQYFPAANAQLRNATKLTHFGEGYDFRNKRLPVWKVELDTPSADTLYIDVANGVLADRSNRASRREAWLFSSMHKWNPVSALTGRATRDGMIVLTLSLALILALLGWRLGKRRKRA